MSKGNAVGTITDLAASPGDGQATLTWTDIANETGYQPRYSTTSGGPWTNFGPELAANSTSVVVTGLTNGTLYYFTVTATDGTNTTVSNEASATPVGNYNVSFAGTVPLQTLAADLSFAAANNDRDVSFAATVPVQTLAASVAHEVPNDDVSFAGTVPLQSLAADLSHTAPNNDRSVSFSASVPMQALAAALAFEAAANNDRTASFSGTAPMQVLMATVDHEAPGFGVTFLGTVPVQALAVVLGDVAEPVVAHHPKKRGGGTNSHPNATVSAATHPKVEV